MAARLATAADFPPEFDGLTEREVSHALRVAAQWINVDAMGDRASEMHWLKAADYLATNPTTRGRIDGLSAQGAIKRDKADKVEVEYFQAGGSSMHSSEYGRRFEDMLRALPPQTPFLVL